MTYQDVQRIFGVSDVITVGFAVIFVEDWLEKLGFADIEPTKEALLAHDRGKMGYATFIESGNFEIQE
jgi:hypothetical protein